MTGVNKNLVQARVEWQAVQQQPPRTGGFILNCNRRSKAVATVTRPVPWTGEYTQAIDQVYGSPIVTPGHMGYHANALNLEVPLDVAHLSDLEAQPRPFRTPSTDSHAMLPPPGFAVPLTPRERMARTRHFEELQASLEEPHFPGGPGTWGHVARGSSSMGDRAESASGESLTSVERTHLPFSSKISLIRDILGDKVPVSVDSSEVTGRVTSLLSRQGPDDRPSSTHLPLVVRSALSATSSAIATATRESPWSARAEDGLPLSVKALRGSARYYRVSSPDFPLSAPTVSRELASERSTSVTLPQRTIKSLEEHTRMSLGCASVSEWFLAAVSSILHGCQESVSSASSPEELRTSSLDLLSSAGIAIQYGTLATAAVLGELTLARRDSHIRSPGTSSRIA